ncbi:hypothetical protein [Caldinitratiruptor microaerophilus]|uniref:Uncharacterized protein n=1 Tax=Caldinitratiruptor microaerophilus TaxID=671077 RepID=A0AA35CIJ3_9FIRM|nr:hypothetical protein [Caldinitratiruptor microaerophilus]BDG59717.1 hypothetical protein caldi_08070 [Caldinitratiruptor microaerophilus]
MEQTSQPRSTTAPRPHAPSQATAPSLSALADAPNEHRHRRRRHRPAWRRLWDRMRQWRQWPLFFLAVGVAVAVGALVAVISRL